MWENIAELQNVKYLIINFQLCLPHTRPSVYLFPYIHFYKFAV